jgi:1,4-dihydroxy-2-naphthoate octaprenyltransferase
MIRTILTATGAPEAVERMISTRCQEAQEPLGYSGFQLRRRRRGKDLMTPPSSTHTHSQQRQTSPAARLRFEMAVTARLLADNASASSLPPLLFTAVACAHYQTSSAKTILYLTTSAVLFVFYQYVFDTSNQARGVQEDMLNKPYRPIPSGMITSQGALRRFWCAMPLYTLLGWLTGTLVWVLLWQAVVIGLNLVSAPRHYFIAKPIAMILGTIAQLAAAWQIVAPLDSVGWSWVLVLAITFNLPLPFEDVRDMDGDRRIGRRTLALLIGHWPVRIWFAITMTALPITLHLLLLAPSHAGVFAVVACDTAIVALSWTAAARSLLLRTVPADRVTYLLGTFTYCVAMGCGLVVL